MENGVMQGDVFGFYGEAYRGWWAEGGMIDQFIEEH